MLKLGNPIKNCFQNTQMATVGEGVNGRKKANLYDAFANVINKLKLFAKFW